MNTIL